MLHTDAMATNFFQSLITSVMGFTLHDFSTYDVTFRFISLLFDLFRCIYRNVILLQMARHSVRGAVLKSMRLLSSVDIN